MVLGNRESGIGIKSTNGSGSTRRALPMAWKILIFHEFLNLSFRLDISTLAINHHISVLLAICPLGGYW
ncbi:hypothetical protein [Moorena sp. SIO3H5]|uniref:hypothetical protein n=1 Tax=Moorena sp. SIO3H5 TaxID=2607834 RepID=UPI0013B62CA5|nr:hypothetical protein [Moorena sp. SIO3H5]NEO73199.1 hypothetical protein [Moorena sp. SIO3H5]